MSLNVSEKLIRSHLVAGEVRPGSEIALRMDQTLTQDATGTLVMLVLEAMDLDRVRAELSVQYVDHNLIQTDNRNADDHEFLRSACRRFGIWFSGPGNGVSHPLHMIHFGAPGKSLVGSDSHTPAAGALGLLAVGAGGMEVAAAMAGEPVHLAMPEIWGIELVGSLPDWVSAKDVILGLLQRHGVEGARGKIIEYHGEGLRSLSAMDRHVLANMGTELGATSTVFPSDDVTRRFLENVGRGDAWVALEADRDAEYHQHDRVDLSTLVPLIAKPSSPENVVPVSDLAGEDIYQAYLGSSANPGYRDFAVPALMVAGRKVADGVSFDVNPTSRPLLQSLMQDGSLGRLVEAGARLHQAGCNGCIGMGQAPATHRNSLRTVPRNFPGRSGTREDRVFLCSPETATASALTGRITDPRTLQMPCPKAEAWPEPKADLEAFVRPASPDEARRTSLIKGPNIKPIPRLDAFPDTLRLGVAIKLGDDISTDEIMPAGAEVMPYRSNIPEIAGFVFRRTDESYVARARKLGTHCIVAGENYGQGSSREHAAIAPRYLGLRVVVAKGFARLHAQNLVNFGVLPLIFVDPDDYGDISEGNELAFEDMHRALQEGASVEARASAPDRVVRLRHELSERQVRLLLAGGMINRLAGLSPQDAGT